MANSKVVNINAAYWKCDAQEALRFMQDDLARSGLQPKDLGATPVEHRYAKGLPAYLIPYGDSGHYRVRVKRDDNKYLGPKGVDPMIYFPMKVSPESFRNADVKYICEGEKKAVAIVKQFGVQAVAIGGCWQWGKGNKVLPELQDGIKAGDTIHYIADRDVIDPKKLHIAKAAKAMMLAIQQLNCTFVCLLPPEPHKGADDWIVKEKHRVTMEELEQLDLASFHWFPVRTLQSQGVQFNVNAEGVVTSHKQMVSSMHNTELLIELLYGSTETIAADKYTGYALAGETADLDAIHNKVKSDLTFLFPNYKWDPDALTNWLWNRAKDKSRLNCVQKYITTLKWDKVKRLDTWLPKAMVLEDTMERDYAERIGMMLVCAMYNRIMDPGCQQDYMFLLSGPQSAGKTTFFRMLGAFPMYNGYTPTSLDEIATGTYTEGAMLRRAIILDMDDLETLSRKSQSDLKRFISKDTDHWRAPYKMDMTSEPRGFIITGSTNNTGIFVDHHGNRRYLMLHIKDIKGVAGEHRWRPELRDQLLAECHARWGEYNDQWWRLDIAKINEVNNAYQLEDPIVNAAHEMLTAGLVLPFQGKEHYISSLAISMWLDEKNYPPTVCGRRLTDLVNAANLPFHLGAKKQIRISKEFEKLPDNVKRMYRPRNQTYNVWVYPIKEK